jgi:hypothetical protein
VHESFLTEFESTFPRRLRIYEKHSENLLNSEEDFIHKLIDSYISLNEPGNKFEKETKFDELCSVTDEFLDYIKIDEQIISKNSEIQQSGDDFSTRLNGAESGGNRLDKSYGPSLKHVYRDLKTYENKRLKRLRAIGGSGSKTQKFADIEIANLLRGVYKHGESNWRGILSEEKFSRSRTINQLVYKWRMIKIFVKGELDSINVKRQKLITMNDWIIAAIKALENKSNVKRDLPSSYLRSPNSQNSKNWDKSSEENAHSVEPESLRSLKRSQSHFDPTDLTPLFSI